VADGEARSYAEEASSKRAAPASPAAEVGVAGLLIGLQRTAGNAAVARLVSSRATLARDADGGGPAANAEPMAGGASSIVVKIEGVGEFTAESVSLDGKKDVHLTKKMDKLSSKLAELAAKGTLFKAEIRFMREGKPTMTIKIPDGMISSYNTGGPSGSDESIENLAISGTLQVKQGDGEDASEGEQPGSETGPRLAPAPG
jgi:Type VI secretion system effector, Hcp